MSAAAAASLTVTGTGLSNLGARVSRRAAPVLLTPLLPTRGAAMSNDAGDGWDPVATILVDGEEVTGPLVRWWATPPVQLTGSQGPLPRMEVVLDAPD